MRERGTFDKLLELRAAGTAAITATASLTGVEVAGLSAMDQLLCIINVEAFDDTTDDETYQFTVEVCATVGGTYEIVGTLLAADIEAKGAPYKWEVPLSGKMIQDICAGAKFVRITATLGGTTPSLTYNAFLAQT